jgi:plastocyanin
VKRKQLAPYAAITLSLGIAVSCSTSPREVTLVARGMTFVLADEPDVPNPVIVLGAGQRVRLVLRNEAPGLLHDFGIPAWRVQVTQIRAGQTAEVTFTVPKQPGRYEYLCRPHAELMKGEVEVR